jgi:hypothetical protein
MNNDLAPLMASEIERIAASLTYKQAAAVRGVFAWSNPAEQDEGEAELYRLGIWNPRPAYGKSAITPLGLAVRAHLEKSHVE